MAILFSFFIFIVFAAGLSFAGVKLYVKPKEAMERVAGAELDSHDTPVHPSLIFHDLVKRLGTLVPASPKDVTVMQRRLIRAGYRNPNALKILYGAKAVFGVLIPSLVGLALLNSTMDPGNKAAAILAAVAVGFFGPNEFVRMAAKRRQKQIHRGLANALDLLVVCVESGLGLDQAIMQVAKELEQAHPEITEELAIVNFELKAGKRRAEALRNLADRTAVEDLKKLVAVLIQADRFGTGVSQSLRAHSDYMRVQARQVAEEKAAKLGVKLVFPIFFCILPSLFVVTVGPVVMKIMRELLPMMNNM
ncbi:MAG TPA: type II secretion system F family protein [Bryobacteraceae bacterium]|nr:type II secretion system F family protein [Bryobacteraceae bacterium]